MPFLHKIRSDIAISLLFLAGWICMLLVTLPVAAQTRCSTDSFGKTTCRSSGTDNANLQPCSQWLKQPAKTAQIEVDKAQNKVWLDTADRAVDKRLAAAVSNIHLHPENKQWVSAGLIAKTS